ncbi:hypothetical protein LTR95_006543 [Oleoguttula sp. CCFEE 5521]
MAEPQPPNVADGADPPDIVPANAEDRKAAAAMSSLDTRGDADATAPKKDVDLKALNEAMKSLGVDQESKKKPAAAAAVKKEEPKKLIKVDAADVALLADQLDISKPRATDLLRAHDANAVKAMTAWVTAAV